ncbi:MAG: hypothetical protein ABIF77_10340, partial [bacterium]
VADPAACHRADGCQARNIWTLLSERLREFWCQYTLEDLARLEGPLTGIPQQFAASTVDVDASETSLAADLPLPNDLETASHESPAQPDERPF